MVECIKMKVTNSKEGGGSGGLPKPRSSPSCVYHGGKMWVFGGLSGKTRMNDLHSLAVPDSLAACRDKTHEWEKHPTLGLPPKVRYGHSASVRGSTMFVFGGQSGKSIMSDMFSIDLNSPQKTWIEIKVWHTVCVCVYRTVLCVPLHTV